MNFITFYFITELAEMAQSVEHIHGKDGVPGSIPGLGSRQQLTLNS